jgi:DNA invertase Pin-like site-specific DNA recombinase
MPTATPFMLHVYAAVAEEERRMIAARTKAGLAAAKAKGVDEYEGPAEPGGCRLHLVFPAVSVGQW